MKLPNKFLAICTIVSALACCVQGAEFHITRVEIVTPPDWERPYHVSYGPKPGRLLVSCLDRLNTNIKEYSVPEFRLLSTRVYPGNIVNITNLPCGDTLFYGSAGTGVASVKRGSIFAGKRFSQQEAPVLDEAGIATGFVRLTFRRGKPNMMEWFKPSDGTIGESASRELDLPFFVRKWVSGLGKALAIDKERVLWFLKFEPALLDYKVIWHQTQYRFADADLLVAGQHSFVAAVKSGTFIANKVLLFNGESGLELGRYRANFGFKKIQAVYSARLGCLALLAVSKDSLKRAVLILVSPQGREIQRVALDDVNCIAVEDFADGTRIYGIGPSKITMLTIQ